jgi:hypothetical protein
MNCGIEYFIPKVFPELSFNPIAGQASNKMRKLFKQPSRGKLVVHVVWAAYSNTPDQVQISAKRLATNRIVHASRQSKYTTVDYTVTKNVLKVEFDRLEPGDYELTLYNITEPIKTIHLCSGISLIANADQFANYLFCPGNVCAPEENKMQHQRVVGCHLYLGEMLLTVFETTIYDSSKCNLKIRRKQ